MTPDEIAKGLDDTDHFGSSFTCQFCDSDRNVQLITLDMGLREGNRVFWLCDVCRRSPDLKIVRESLDDSDEFGAVKLWSAFENWTDNCVKLLLTYEDGAKAYWYYHGNDSVSILKLVEPTGEVHKFSGIAPDNVPIWFQSYFDGFMKANEFGGAPNRKMTPQHEQEFEDEMAKPGIELEQPPRISEGLDDKDTFEKPTYCDRCNEPFRREELTRVNPYEPSWSVDRVCPACLEIINQGPQDDKWLERFYTESLDDKDEFVDNTHCERCNSTDWVEPTYFNNTVENLCRWCKKALFTESLEDADEFGYVKATSAYEDSGIDDSKHVFTFEDGARLYQDAQVVDKGYGETDVRYRVVLKLPDGSIHRSDTLKYSEQDLPPPFNVYMDGVYAFIREGDVLPFPLDLLKEFHRVMQQPDVMESIAEDLDDKDDFGDPPFIQVTITDMTLSAKDAIARTLDVLKNPHGSHMNGWNVTGIEVTGYSPNDEFQRADTWNIPSYESLENTPGALLSFEGFLQHNEPRLATPELAFTDSVKGPGVQAVIYVGY